MFPHSESHVKTFVEITLVIVVLVNRANKTDHTLTTSTAYSEPNDSPLAIALLTSKLALANNLSTQGE